MNNLKIYTTAQGEALIYFGNPNLSLLDDLANGPGDLWHSSLDQGYANAFQDIIYQTAVFWWYLNDFEELDKTVSWRVNPNMFVIRKGVWEAVGGLDHQYTNAAFSGIDLGYNLLRNLGGIPLYVKGLFEPVQENKISVNAIDRYLFYRKYFKIHHSYYMLYRKGIWKWFGEWKAFKLAKQKYKQTKSQSVPVRKLNPVTGKPKVSMVIPTMNRQEHTETLLRDMQQQTYPVCEVVVVDATAATNRDPNAYQQANYSFNLKVAWQTSKGSCRARNEAIDLCSGDYIIFADDDIRVNPDYVENHIRFLQTYKADACNGLDIMATHLKQNLTDLNNRLKKLGEARWKAGCTSNFSNANSCVSRKYIQKLIGNDVNFDGGYGEDSDFGLTLLKQGAIVLFNPFAVNLHLKPPTGGYRDWGLQARILGKKRKRQPWELDTPVKYIRPIPSPTITYGILKHFTNQQVKEWEHKYFFIYLFKGSLKGLLWRLLKYPIRKLQFKKSVFYAQKLIEKGVTYK
jgi:glycosyltransferase involved in cell wall biosynthesis